MKIKEGVELDLRGSLAGIVEDTKKRNEALLLTIEDLSFVRAERNKNMVNLIQENFPGTKEYDWWIDHGKRKLVIGKKKIQ